MFKDQFIADATEQGLSKWEKIFGSSFGRKEHTPFDNFSGNIGTVRSTKYTEVARK